MQQKEVLMLKTVLLMLTLLFILPRAFAQIVPGWQDVAIVTEEGRPLGWWGEDPYPVSSEYDGSWAVLWTACNPPPCPPEPYVTNIIFKKFLPDTGEPGPELTIGTAQGTWIGYDWTPYTPLTDLQGDFYVVYKNERNDLTLAKIERGERVVFQQPFATLGPPPGGQHAASLGSDGNINIAYTAESAESRIDFLRINREGRLLMTARTVASAQIYPSHIDHRRPPQLVSDGQGFTYLFYTIMSPSNNYDGTAYYVKINEQSGKIASGPIKITPRVGRAQSIAVANNKVHLVWSEPSNNPRLYYAQYSAITGQPILEEYQLPRISQEQAYDATVLASQDSGVIDIVHKHTLLDWIPPYNARVYRDAIFLVQLEISAPRPRVTHLTELSSEGGSPRAVLGQKKIHGVWTRRRGFFSQTTGIFGKVYRPEIRGKDPRIGRENLYRLAAPLNAGEPYAVALSLGAYPGVVLPDRRRLLLNPDALFFLSFTSNIIRNQQGYMDREGGATVGLNVPPDVPGGINLYAAFVTMDASGNIRAISATRPLLTVQ